ncbi:MAG: GNAT family N-acetyltransferase [Cyanobacteria bacterium P01_H01_bin.74]
MTAPVTVLEFPFEERRFKANWMKYLANKFPLLTLDQDFALLKRSGPFGVSIHKQLHMVGWNSAWVQDLEYRLVDKLQWIGPSLGWSSMRFKWVDSLKNHQAHEQLKQSGYRCYTEPADCIFWADISGGWQAYLLKHSKSRRKDIKRQLKRAEKNQLEYITFSGKNAVQDFFNLFIPAHIDYWKSKTGNSFFEDEREQQFFKRWITELYQENKVILSGLKLNTELAHLAVTICKSKNTHLGLLSITTGKQSKLAPGIVGAYLQIRVAAEAKATWFNMGPGYHLYKQQAATHQQTCYQTIVVNPASFRGRLYEKFLLLKKMRFLSSKNLD